MRVSCPLCDLGMAWVLDPDHKCTNYPEGTSVMEMMKVKVMAHPEVIMEFDLPTDAWIATWEIRDDRGWMKISCSNRRMDDTYESLRKMVKKYKEMK